MTAAAGAVLGTERRHSRWKCHPLAAPHDPALLEVLRAGTAVSGSVRYRTKFSDVAAAGYTVFGEELRDLLCRISWSGDAAPRAFIARASGIILCVTTTTGGWD